MNFSRYIKVAQNRKHFLITITLLVILSFPLFFYNLGYLPIRLWDESRLALNTSEMLDNHNFIVTYYDSNPEMWNTKPPLLIWLQYLSVRTLGLNEFSIRFPSAIAGFLTCILVYIFIQYKTKNYWFSLLWSIILLTSKAFFELDHSTRTGDYDAMLVLWTTAYIISFWLACENIEKTAFKNWLLLFFIFLFFAVMTKGIAGLLLTPGFAIFVLWKRKALVFLKSGFLYIYFLVFIGLVLGYFFYREHLNPGYLKAVWFNDLGGRFGNNKTGEHSHEFLYYFFKIKDNRFTNWFWFLPFSLLSVFILSKDKIKRELAIYLTILIITFFLVISKSATSLIWYDLPLYPLFAIIICIGLISLYEYIHNKINKQKHLIILNVVFSIFMLIVIINPYLKQFKNISNKEDDRIYDTSYLLKESLDNKRNLNGYNLYYPEYKAHVKYYLRLLNKKGCIVNYKRNSKDFEQEDFVIVPRQEWVDTLGNYFKYSYIESYKSVSIIRLDSLKNN
jgi:4-amino-4-deoxy-L-arabinose transferase-like glycosyltransferase